MKYHKDMTVAHILYDDEKVLEIFEKYGLPCSTCNGAETETLEIAARVHGCDLEKILEDLNKIK